MPVQLQSHVGDEGDEARIEIIPLIDIMFFLLAAFMLVSLSMTHMKRVPIDLPEATTGEVQAQAPPVEIAVDANGVITWNREIVTATEITARLASMGSVADLQVMIAADENARHKQVLMALNAVRKAGVVKVGFETSE